MIVYDRVPNTDSTVQYSTVQYSTVQYSTVQYNIHLFENRPVDGPILGSSLSLRIRKYAVYTEM